MIRSKLAAVATIVAASSITSVALAGPHARGGALCGTPPILADLNQSRALGEGLPRVGAAREGECAENLRPTYVNEQTRTDDEYKFTIHYSLDASDEAVVTEADVDRVVAVMQHVMSYEEEDLGYSRPPTDDIDATVYCDGPNGEPADGGSGYFDVYFVAEDDVYGYAQPLTDVTGSVGAATSYLALSTWILDVEGALEVTAAHEFFHSVQFTYDSYENAAWMETTATWMEEQVYDDVNDYLNYLPDAFDYPELSLDTFDNSGVIQYGNVIWPLYFTQAVSASAVLNIWEVCGETQGDNALEAQKTVLDDVYEGGFAGAVVDFRSAMYDVNDFEEGSTYPDVYFKDEDAIDGNGRLFYTGAHVIGLLPGEAGDPLSVCFEAGDDTTTARLYLGGDRADRALLGTMHNGDQLDVSEHAADPLVLVVSNPAISGLSGYSYATSIDGECIPPGGCGRCDTGRSNGATSLVWALAALGIALVRRRQ